MKKSIRSRRAFLRGAGVSLAIPPMLSLLTRTEAACAQIAAASTESGAPLRMAFMSIPNGVQQEHWFPTTEGEELVYTTNYRLQ